VASVHTVPFNRFPPVCAGVNYHGLGVFFSLNHRTAPAVARLCVIAKIAHRQHVNVAWHQSSFHERRPDWRNVSLSLPRVVQPPPKKKAARTVATMKTTAMTSFTAVPT